MRTTANNKAIGFALICIGLACVVAGLCMLSDAYGGTMYLDSPGVRVQPGAQLPEAQ